MSSAEWSSDFEVVVDLSVLGSRSEVHVGLASGFRHHLHVDVAQIISGKGLALLGVDVLLLILDDVVHSALNALQVLDVALVMGRSQETVVLFVHGELEWVLVVSEQGVVAIRQVSQGSSL